MPNLSWVLIDFVERYLDGVYEECVQRCDLRRPRNPPEFKAPTSFAQENAPEQDAQQADSSDQHVEIGGISKARDAARKEEFETEIRISREIVQAINVVRKNPRPFAPRVEAARTREGASLIREAAFYLLSTDPCSRVLEDMPALADTCVKAFQGAGEGPLRHTPHLPNLMEIDGFGGRVVNEMFW